MIPTIAGCTSRQSCPLRRANRRPKNQEAVKENRAIEAERSVVLLKTHLIEVYFHPEIIASVI
jgi:hypothetical protein